MRESTRNNVFAVVLGVVIGSTAAITAYAQAEQPKTCNGAQIGNYCQGFDPKFFKSKEDCAQWFCNNLCNDNDSNNQCFIDYTAS